MTTEQTELTPDAGSESALSETELTTAAPEVLANSLGDYLQAWWRRIKNGESGALPVIAGLVAIIIFFQIEQPAFLTDANLVGNLFEGAAIYIVIGAGETFILLLSEIDLSLGYGMGIGGFVIAELIAPPVNFPWWLGIIGGVVAMGCLGLVQGMLVTQLGLPSFIVTLGGELGFLGIMLELANVDKTAVGGVIQVSPTSPISKLVSSNMSTSLGWIAMGVCVLLFAAVTLNRNRSRRARGLHTPPVGVAALTIGIVAIAGILLVYVCNNNRSHLGVVEGVPWVIPMVLLIVLVYSWILNRTRTGRYIYAVGNNKEAARRAGIKVNWIVTFAFIMSSATAALAGLIYISEQGSMATDIDGGTLVLYAVAAAVIGGTALFGGRGRMVNALLGGLVIAVVFDGLALMGVGPAVQDIVTAVVLIAAVSLDAIVRRRAAH
ncbi:MAG: sugar ABC transporter permease [Solirubrobacteraceae bacterium]